MALTSGRSTGRLTGDAPVHAARARLREVLTAPGAVLGAGRAAGRAAPPVTTPFGDAQPVEGGDVRRMAVTGRGPVVEDAAFADGIQRFSVEGWVGVVPVARAYVAAAVMRRRRGSMVVTHHVEEEFVVTIVDALPPEVAAALREVPLPVLDAGVPERHHPILDLQRVAEVVERRRRHAEREVIHAFRRRHADAWVVVDGGIRDLDRDAEDRRLVGLIKSHETQFLAGADLECALTLGEGERTSVFARRGGGGEPVYTWYLRLWDWSGRDILYGLVRLERPPRPDLVDEADAISRWMLAERAPLSRDDRWDRLLYPIHEVENYLRACAGGWR